ncbi:MAG: hypothetical protein JSR33_12440, partial [Proteobacteria bacterium]|nr:hypothetical protein [Pseudomonadota bacterium]
MKFFLSSVLLLIFISAHAADEGSFDVGGVDAKLLHICNCQNSGHIYAENYQHQQKLIYKSNHPFPPGSSFMSDQDKDSDILSVVFECDAETGDRSCIRFFNRRNNQLSIVYPYILDYDSKRDIVAFYEKDKNKVVLSRAFNPCSTPLTYPIILEEDSDFGIKTKFLSTGNLQLDYETPRGKDVLKIIPVNY